MATAINTLKELMTLTSDGGYFVRWSSCPEKDVTRGHSVNHGTGSRECGLSFLEITAQEDASFDAQLEYLVNEASAYKHLAGGKCWLGKGTVCGTGSDGEPLLSNVEICFVLTTKCTKELDAWYHAVCNRALWHKTMTPELAGYDKICDRIRKTL